MGLVGFGRIVGDAPHVDSLGDERGDDVMAILPCRAGRQDLHWRDSARLAGVSASTGMRSLKSSPSLIEISSHRRRSYAVRIAGDTIVKPGPGRQIGWSTSLTIS